MIGCAYEDDEIPCEFCDTPMIHKKGNEEMKYLIAAFVDDRWEVRRVGENMRQTIIHEFQNKKSCTQIFTGKLESNLQRSWEDTEKENKDETT